MKPSKIFDIMDIAEIARSKGLIWNPMFTGEAGLGKSEVVQQWVKRKKEKTPEFGFIDLRIAYFEAPDLIGYQETKEVDGLLRTIHCLPEFWPTSGEGLLLLEEPNRGTTGVMNCLMQLLTDRQVGPNYKLPPGWIIAACVNPDSSSYDTNAMDIALRDRFEIFEVDYDHTDFVKYIEANNWSDTVVRYIKSGAWIYKKSDLIGKEGKYISPRTWSKVNNAERSSEKEKNKTLHRIICHAGLGKHVGTEYWKTCFEEAPVMANDLLADKEAALKRLEKMSNPKKYQGDQIAATVESIIAAYGGQTKEKGGKCEPDQIDEDTMVAVAKTIPSDQAINLIRECGVKLTRELGIMTTQFLQDFLKRHPDLKAVMIDNLRVAKAVDK